LRFLLALASIAALAGCEPRELPSEPNATHLVVGYPPGGGADLLARRVASELGAALGTPVVIENLSGSAGAHAARHVAHSPRDGHTLLIGTSSAVTLATPGNPVEAYDSFKEVCPLALVAETSHVLLVAADSAYDSLESLVAEARLTPEQLTYASLGTGSSSHAIGALFAQESHLELLHVPYRSAPAGMKDVLGGHVSMMVGTVQSALPLLYSGRLRALAVSGRERSRFLPLVPTFAELGLPDLTSTTWYGLFAPCGLPSEVQGKLLGAVDSVMHKPAVTDVISREGGEPAYLLGEGFRRYLEAQSDKWNQVASLLR
jgi:tripartite-type tricarboxylate transporter receptor subunit TctC